MLSVAFKNGVLMILIILIVHYLIKNNEIERFEFKIPEVIPAPVASEEPSFVSQEIKEDELYQYLFKENLLPTPPKEEKMFSGITPYDAADIFYKF
jgi:hypothetical protein